MRQLIALFFTIVVLWSQSVASQAKYCGTGEIVNTSESIIYTDKTDTERNIGTDFPSYEEFKYQNSCAVVAAATLLGYYDAFYDEIIPNFVSKYGIDNTGNIIFNEQTQEVDELIDILYGLMKTNINGAGTASVDFISGLRQYVLSRGRSINFQSVIDGRQFNKNTYQNAIEKGDPVVLFLNKFKYTLYIGDSSPLTIQYIEGNIGHALVAYGYREVQYYRTETIKKWEPIWYNLFRWVTYSERVNFKTDYFVRVSFGNGTVGYLNLNDLSAVDGGYSIIVQ